jgi:hypothetical protein
LLPWSRNKLSPSCQSGVEKPATVDVCVACEPAEEPACLRFQFPLVELPERRISLYVKQLLYYSLTNIVK